MSEEVQTVLMKTLVNMGVERGWFSYAVISFQPNDIKEIIGPFSSREDASTWSIQHFDHKTEDRHEIVFMLDPKRT